MTRDLVAARVRSVSYVAEEPRRRAAGLRRPGARARRRLRRAVRPPVRHARLVVPSTSALIAWWERHGRHDLPWRATRDPWAVLVSELMLQQTQVPRVAAAVAGVPRAVPDAGGVRGRAGRRRRPGVGRARLQPPGGQPPPLRDRGGRAPRRRAARRPRRAARPARHRARTRRGRCSCSPSSATSGSSTPTPAASSPGPSPGAPSARRRRRRSPTPPCRPATPGAGARRCSTSAPLSARSGRRAATRARCDEPGARWAAAGLPRARSRRRVGRHRRRRSRRFDGCDRQGRGRLVDALRRGPVAAADARRRRWAGPTTPPAPARVAATLVADGLATLDDQGRYVLP